MDQTATMYYDDIVAKCKLGDVQSYGTLYRQYAQPMFNTSIRIVNNRADAEDVLQESFSAAFRWIDQFDYSSTFGAWLKRIVVNKSVDVLRKRRMVVLELNETAAEKIPDPVEINEETFRFTVDTIKKKLGLLPNGYRTVLSLHLFEGYSYTEIADMLQIAESTVRTQYHRGRHKLLCLLQKEVSDD